MPTGELAPYLSRKFGGVLHHTFLIPSAIVGGYGNPNTISEEVSIDDVLDHALLALVLSGNELRYRGFMWKVSFGRVTLTREFKPQSIVNAGSTSQAIMVFDVSALTRSTGRYEVKVSCESATPVRVESISVIGLSTLEGSEAEITYWGGPVVLQSGEEVVLELPNDGSGEAELTLSATMPSRNSKLVVKAGKEFSEVLEGFVATDFRRVRIPLRKGLKNVTLKLVDEEGLSRKAFINEVIFYKPVKPGPLLRLEAVKEGGTVKLAVKNVGTSPVRNALLVGISTGQLVFRESIRELRPGELRVFRVLPEANTGNPVIYRLIYSGVWGQAIEAVQVK